MSIARKAFVTLVVALGLLAGAGAAAAGPNPPWFIARHLYICAPSSGAHSTIWWANVTGNNEHDQYISDSPKAQIGNPGGCQSFQKTWWWKGTVAIHWFIRDTNGNFHQSKPEWTSCDVLPGTTPTWTC